MRLKHRSWSSLAPPAARTFCGSAEREGVGLHLRLEKLDLELAIGDGRRLSDQLVQPLIGGAAATRPPPGD
jgi:hypothetical protein